MTRETEIVNENFAIAFCSICIDLSLPVVENDDYKYKMAHVLCLQCFSGVLTDERYKDMEILYALELHPYQKSGPQVVIKPPQMLTFSDTKPVAVKCLPLPGASKYNSILYKCPFKMLVVLIDRDKEDN